MCRNDDRGRAAYLGQLLDAHGVGQHVRAATAVLLVEVHAHHPELAHLADGLPRESFFLIHLGSQIAHFVFREVPIHLPEHEVLV